MQSSVMGIFDKLKQGLQRTTQQLKEVSTVSTRWSVSRTRRRRARARSTSIPRRALEEILLMADVGVAASGEIVSAVKKRQRRGESLRELVKQEMLRVLESVDADGTADAASRT